VRQNGVEHHATETVENKANIAKINGEGGIRTHGDARRHTGFRDRTHASVKPEITGNCEIPAKNWVSHWASVIDEHPELAAILDLWADIPKPVRESIITLVKAAMQHRSP